jgi:hypothetical protein
MRDFDKANGHVERGEEVYRKAGAEMAAAKDAGATLERDRGCDGTLGLLVPADRLLGEKPCKYVEELVGSLPPTPAAPSRRPW